MIFDISVLEPQRSDYIICFYEHIQSKYISSIIKQDLNQKTLAVISANATCGDNGAEEFCRETAGKRVVVCDVCEGPEGPSSRRHPAGLAVDGDPSTWWQSPIITDGNYQNVELVAVLPGGMINKKYLRPPVPREMAL
ncbi:putative laminin alpha-1 2 chain [Danaus plexippus plexippus]|uniref:Laminin alpha-1 2 chain n=1 Tax=Danaus plexippus plexippus TaxID=278856 RepID=A0A212F7V9_DANPL|nr:putative laminin alpha-1 2 chain [Danaus plexippus plexippus]